MTTLAARIRKADEMIESFAFLEVGERLIRTFLEAASEREQSAAGILRTGKPTHKELAARIGSSRCPGVMKVLVAKGIIRETEGPILIASDASEHLKKKNLRPVEPPPAGAGGCQGVGLRRRNTAR